MTISKCFAMLPTPALRYNQEPDLIAEHRSLADSLKPSRSFRRLISHLAVWAFLLTFAWLAHFSQSRNIGFYSDDQTFAVRPLSWSPADFSLWLRTKTISYPEPQGRPLGFMLGILFPYLGDRLAGVNGMFIVGWWILSLNAILFYHLLYRSFSQPIPMLGAIGFLLFPADTTRPFLCHQHILQPSLTFMLIAAHLYLRGGLARRILAYITVTLCLITYESALLPFIAIPLLEHGRDRQWRQRFIRHVVTVLGIIAFIGLTRKLGHEYRTEEASGSKITVVWQIIAGSVIGPATAIWSFAYRAYTAARHLYRVPGDAFSLLAATGIFCLILSRCRQRDPQASDEVRRTMEFGGVALAVSYLFSFTHFPPSILEGQTTSVHLAAAIGGSVLLAGLATAVLRRSRMNVAAIAAVALYLGLLFTSAMAEQDGFVTIWQERQHFWTRLMDLCPDLEDHTLIVCDGQLPQPNWLVLANCWSDSVVLEQSYQMPDTFTQLPQVSCFPPESSGTGFRTWLSRSSTGQVVWMKSPYGRKVGDELIEENTILLHIDRQGRITRSSGSIDISGMPFHLKDAASRRPLPFATTRFYNILTGTSR